MAVSGGFWQLTDIAMRPGLPKHALTVDWKELAPLSLEFITIRLIVQLTFILG